MADHEMDSQLTNQETKNVTALEGLEFKKRKVQARSDAAGSSAHYSAGTPAYPSADTLADPAPCSSADTLADPAPCSSADSVADPTAYPSTDASAEPPSRHILSLPNEVLLAIFSFLDITNLPSVLDVCSRWREVITSSRSWQTLDFTAVEDSGLHVKVAMAVGHQARRVLGAAPLGKVAEQVLRNCPNLVELSMPDAIIGVNILGDIIAMCPMIESIKTCVQVPGDNPADTPSLIRVVGDVNLDSEEANYISTASIVNNLMCIDSLLYYSFETRIFSVDWSVIHASYRYNAIFSILQECRGRFSLLSLEAIIKNGKFGSPKLRNTACNIKDFIGDFSFVFPSEKFAKMQAMTDQTKVIIKYGSPLLEDV
ncbi:uncharacterized protein LOC108678073 [Hyalella azteca]|uniref:Uncharacterized protein LOC108678073 n=1 Tax=Hyalella azteca TaxID=294128 RepID=A0A8B7P7G6_HYAAZ|nr:uncharacterized protein LOC108678073 [Hyalella azteca]